ncbi:hypothetical protein ACHZ98_08550 [Streptomyces sp. MAR4 CNY-716]
MTAPQPRPLAAPATPADHPPLAAGAPAPAGAVPVVRPRQAGPGPAPGAGAGTSGPGLPVQRQPSSAGDLAVPKGVPAKAVPARGRSGPASGPPGRGAAQRAGAPQDTGIDLDDLARRLLDPMARLLRTELRRGRERTGRPYDGRR